MALKILTASYAKEGRNMVKQYLDIDRLWEALIGTS